MPVRFCVPKEVSFSKSGHQPAAACDLQLPAAVRRRLCDARPSSQPHPPTDPPARPPPGPRTLRQVAYGQRLFVVGNLPELGGWDAGRGLKLKWHEGHIWAAEAELGTGARVEFKVRQGRARPIRNALAGSGVLPIAGLRRTEASGRPPTRRPFPRVVHTPRWCALATTAPSGRAGTTATSRCGARSIRTAARGRRRERQPTPHARHPTRPPPPTQIMGEGHSLDVHCRWGDTRARDVRPRDLSGGNDAFEPLAQAAAAVPAAARRDTAREGSGERQRSGGSSGSAGSSATSTREEVRTGFRVAHLDGGWPVAGACPSRGAAARGSPGVGCAPCPVHRAPRLPPCPPG